jgi:hypothetical protein
VRACCVEYLAKPPDLGARALCLGSWLGIADTGVGMNDLDSRTSTHAPGRSRLLWLRVLGLVILGGVLLLVISLPGLANEDQSSHPSLGVYIVLALVLAAVMSRIYVVVRRSGASGRRALLIALAVVPGSYFVAAWVLLLVVYIFSS